MDEGEKDERKNSSEKVDQGDGEEPVIMDYTTLLVQYLKEPATRSITEIVRRRGGRREERERVGRQREK